VCKYNGSWTKEQIALFTGIDDAPVYNSENLVKSGGVYAGVANLGVCNKVPINNYISEIYISDPSITLNQIDFAIASPVSSGEYAGKYLNLLRLRTSNGNVNFMGVTYYDSEAEAMTEWNTAFPQKIALHNNSEGYIIAFTGRTFVPTNQVSALPVASDCSNLDVLPNIKNYFQEKDIDFIRRIGKTGYIYKDDIFVQSPYATYAISLENGSEYVAEVILEEILDYDVTVYVRRYPNGTTINITSAIIKAGDNYARLTFEAGETDANQYRIVITNTGQNAYDASISVRLQDKSLKVLFVGSSFGVNTISMFPVLATKAGVDIVCGSLYYGSASIGLVTSRPLAHQPSKWALNTDYGWYKKFMDGAWKNGTGEEGRRTYKYALQDEKWDIIIIQRGAEELKLSSAYTLSWTDEQTSCLQQMVEYTRSHCDYEPVVMFADGLANPVGHAERFGTQTRETQIQQTQKIIETAQVMKSKFGIDVIPVGVALQNARNTVLSQYGYHDGLTSYPADMVSDTQHLDAGIGYYVTGATLFEFIIKPRFGISVMNLDYLPVINDVRNCWVQAGGISDADMFNGISAENINIAKYAVLDAIATPTEISDTIGERYSSIYNVAQNLTGCQSCFTSTKCETTFFALITPDSGKVLGTPTIMMGNTDITSAAYSTITYDGVVFGVIDIPTVTGDLQISINAI
jgi:hypothetical protein